MLRSRIHLALALSLIILLAHGPSAPAVGPSERAAPPGTGAPHVLPARGAVIAAAQPRTWLVGAEPGGHARRVAARYGARLLSPRGTFVVGRGRARAFAGALRDAGVYRFAEPNRELVPQQAPPGGDEFAATDWRTFLLNPGLTPPPTERAPLTAVIDAAVDTTHPELADVRVSGDPFVSDLHGTAVASVIAGRANGVGMVGMYPGAPVLSIGTPLRTAAVARAIASSVDAGARVINLSLGGPVPSYAMLVEIAYAVSQDVLVVAAAGNDYLSVLPDGTTNPVMYPAAFPHVMSVSSMGHRAPAAASRPPTARSTSPPPARQCWPRSPWRSTTTGAATAISGWTARASPRRSCRARPRGCSPSGPVSVPGRPRTCCGGRRATSRRRGGTRIPATEPST
jgi:hypothetical protein